MYTSFIAIFCLACASAVPIEYYQPEYFVEQVYSDFDDSAYPAQHVLHKRAAAEDISKGEFWAKQIQPPTPRPVFAQANYDGAGNLLVQGKTRVVDTTNHQLDAALAGARNVKHPDMWTKQGGIDYTYKPNESGLSVSAINHPLAGTKVTGQGTYNFFESADKSFRAGVTAGRGQLDMGGRNPTSELWHVPHSQTFLNIPGQ